MAAYTSTASAHVDFNLPQNSEEKEISSQDFEKEFLTHYPPTILFKINVQDLIFPSYIELKPQMVFIDVLKPPLA